MWNLRLFLENNTEETRRRFEFATVASHVEFATTACSPSIIDAMCMIWRGGVSGGGLTGCMGGMTWLCGAVYMHLFYYSNCILY